MRIVRRLSLLSLPFILLAACEPKAPHPAAAPVGPAAQEAACAAAIAAHTRLPVTAFTTRWASANAGIATVEVRDGARLHLCTVDGAGRVLGYEHPGA